MAAAAWVGLLALGAHLVEVAALPPPAQLVFAPTRTTSASEPHEFNVLHHLAAISPYFDSHNPGLSSSPPPHCVVGAATYYVRHGNIAANDDEYEETIGPFVEKLTGLQEKWIKQGSSGRSLGGSLAFLKDWKSPIDEDAKGTGTGLEDLTDSGKSDAVKLGKRLRKLYSHLLPHEEKGHQETFNVWAASAKRDVGSAHGFIHGIIPDHPQPGDGDGEDDDVSPVDLGFLSWVRRVFFGPGQDRKKHRTHVNLIKVNVKEADWGKSLTPHKVCDRFDKTNGKPERDQWRDVYTKPIIERFKQEGGEEDWDPNDIVSMQQLCGYETVIRGSSPFCSAFTKEEILDFEYYNDLYYYFMMGYAQPFTSALGVPFLITATKKLLNLTELEYPSKRSSTQALGGPDFPTPTAPPNNTDTLQRLWVYFTHREEPPVVLTALGLFNDSSPLSPTSRDPNRLWKTSEMIPFLGHVALERLHCKTPGGGKEEFIRVLVNTSPRPLDQCQSGPGKSCPAKDWVEWIKRRKGEVGSFEENCKKEDEEGNEVRI